MLCQDLIKSSYDFTKLYIMRGREVFLNSHSMDNLFLNRMNSWQGLVKKEQESIFEKSTGLPYNLQFLLKMRFRHAPVLSNNH